MKLNTYLVFIILLSLILFTKSSSAQCIVGNCENGYSVFKLENGDMYTGNWENGARHGYGRYDWANGAFYVGEFKFNGLHGKGAFYTADGGQIVGVFEDNLFQGPDTTAKIAAIVAAPDVLTWEKWVIKDNEAKMQALQSPNRVEFGILVNKVITDFATDFKTLQTAQRPILIERQAGWYSNLMAKNSLEAGVVPADSTRKAAYYNILYLGTDSLEARKLYNDYVNVIKNLKISCCTTLSDTYKFSGPTYSSDITTWLPLTFNEGFSEEIYSDMVMEIALNTALGAEGWQITYKIYHINKQ